MNSTSRRRTDVFLNLQNEIHRLLNVPEDRPDIIRPLLAAIRESSGADGVGIRFRNVDDFPYVRRNGFPEGFLLKGSSADASIQEIRVCRDDNGNVSQECACSKVISGGADTASPFFTPNGSFWTNDLTALTDLPENRAAGASLRNGCVWRGYGSIAIIPIRSKGQTIGALQFGYPRKGHFTPEAINLLESVGVGIGEMLFRKQTEERLEFIKRSIDSAPISAYWMDLEGNFIYVNESGCRSLGYSRDELLQMRLFDIAPHITEARLGEIRDILGTDNKLVSEIVCRRKDGAEFPAEVIVNRVVYGGQVYLSGFVQDITERKMAEQRLRQSETRFRSTFEQAAVGIAHVAADGRFLRINRKFCDILGYSQAEMLERTFQDITHPDHLDKSVQGLKKLLDGEIDVFTVEKMYLHKDGHPVWVGLTSSGVRNEAGAITGFVTVVQDITERKQLESAYKKSESRLREAQHIAHIGSWEHDLPADTFTLSDEALRIFEIADPERVNLTYETYLAFVHPEDRQRIDKIYTRSIADRKPVDTTFRLLFPDGRVKHVHLRHKNHYAPDGTPLQAVGTIQDITAAEQAEMEKAHLRNELAHLSRVMTMTELSGSLAHEINQPLGAIMNNASAARTLNAEPGEGTAEIGEILDDIIADATRAGEIIHKIRGLMGKEEARFEKLDVNALIRGVLELYRNTFTIEKISVSLALQPDLSPAMGDRVRLQQVLMNLVSNAAEAMGHSPSRNLSIHSAMGIPDTITVSVSDSGPGIDAETKSKIFQPFFTTKDDGLGLGLGLRICRSIIEEHGGRIWVEDSPAGGAAFSFCLRAFQEDAI